MGKECGTCSPSRAATKLLEVRSTPKAIIKLKAKIIITLINFCN
jgi:hypothetical protein